MNYVVAALLLGRIPACYTNITSIDAAADESAPSAESEEAAADGNNSGDTAAAEPALAIVRAAAAAEVMPGKIPVALILAESM
jgi:hypothetical protein